jgi:hypothetical protein
VSPSRGRAGRGGKGAILFLVKIISVAQMCGMTVWNGRLSFTLVRTTFNSSTSTTVVGELSQKDNQAMAEEVNGELSKNKEDVQLVDFLNKDAFRHIAFFISDAKTYAHFSCTSVFFYQLLFPLECWTDLSELNDGCEVFPTLPPVHCRRSRPLTGAFIGGITSGNDLFSKLSNLPGVGEIAFPGGRHDSTLASKESTMSASPDHLKSLNVVVDYPFPEEPIQLEHFAEKGYLYLKNLRISAAPDGCFRQ